MDRRTFLRASLFGATALSIPSWAGCAFTSISLDGLEQNDEKLSKGSPLARAYLRAKQGGKPLLVLIVPPLPFQDEELGELTEEQRQQQYEAYDTRLQRGLGLGEILNNGSYLKLWPLALCEAICALPEEIKALVGDFEGAPLLALIETDSERPKAIAIDAELPTLPLGLVSRVSVSGYGTAEKNGILQERSDLYAGLFKASLCPGEQSLSRRAAQSRDTLAQEAALLEKALCEGESLSIEQADRIAGIIAQKARQEPKNQDKLQELLASAVKQRLCNSQIEGSRWATSYGCEVSYEGPEPETQSQQTKLPPSMCGMGLLPLKSQRFLLFYAEQSQG